jgi:hypothetical protein
MDEETPDAAVESDRFRPGFRKLNGTTGEAIALDPSIFARGSNDLAAVSVILELSVCLPCWANR